MNKPTMIAAGLVILVGGLQHARGQDPEAEAAVREVLKRATDLVMSCEIDAYAELWDTDATIFISSGDPLMPISEYLERWRGVCDGGGGIVIEPVDSEIRFHGALAVSAGTLDYEFTEPGGGIHAGTNRFTTVLRETADGWTMVHAHGSELGAHSMEGDQDGTGNDL